MVWSMSKLEKEEARGLPVESVDDWRGGGDVVAAEKRRSRLSMIVCNKEDVVRVFCRRDGAGGGRKGD